MDRAERITGLLVADPYAASLGIELVEVTDDSVVVRMAVTHAHHNFYEVTHGGVVFSLADCAFSLAANAHDERAVAIDTHLVLTAATQAGDVLTATAIEMTKGRTLATYRVTVTRADGRVCGLFTGTVHTP